MFLKKMAKMLTCIWHIAAYRWSDSRRAWLLDTGGFQKLFLKPDAYVFCRFER